MATATERRTSVLLVEDEPMIRTLAVEALLEQGFDVLPVSNASEALKVLMSEAPIDVLFTDIDIVGGMDGATLAQRARELRPDLSVMYTSGKRYEIEHLVPVEGSMFVPKPYDPTDVGHLLDYLVAARKINQRPKANGAH